MSLGKPFLPGRAKSGGRAKGTRNRISQQFLEDLAAEWEKSGPDALKVMAKEHPTDFVKVTAALLPKELTIEDNRLAEMDDTELDTLINEVRDRLRRKIAERVGDGEKPQIH